ncbi:MAG: hypothetical protein KGQ46_10125 [Hyphomicrobiales bacterium]|nr:hypothetical protein [Hyphomicrobiales bacterium]MDE2116162.1 hypothetical protein [Hyphomicrobiales bacterium]
MNNIITKIAIALGLVLILAGSFLFYNGFGIIEAQRGWAEVISGASLIAGGSVVLALAFVLARLDSLALGVRFPESMPVADARAPLSAVHADAPSAGLDHPAMPFPVANAPLDAPSHEAMAPPGKLESEPVGASAHLGMAPVAAAVGLGGAAMMFAQKAADVVHMPPVHNLEVPTLTDHEGHESPADLAHETGEAEAGLGQDLDEDEDGPESAPPEPVAEAEPAASAPAWHLPLTHDTATPPKLDIGDDWFDEALSGKSGMTPPTLLPQIAPVAPPEATAHHEVADHAVASHEVANHNVASHAPASDAGTPAHEPQAYGAAEGGSPAHSEAPAEAPAAAGTQPVVARYSAGGIDYVLYQDGSIDSDDGVDILHFASMEHLKEYMETQSRP